MSYKTDCAQLDEVTEKDRESIQQILYTSCMKKLLGTALRELQGKQDQISAVDLSCDTGVRQGLKLQGEIAGMKRFLDLILEGTNLE